MQSTLGEGELGSIFEGRVSKSMWTYLKIAIGDDYGRGVSCRSGHWFGVAAAVVTGTLCFDLYLGCLTHLLKIDWNTLNRKYLKYCHVKMGLTNGLATTVPSGT